MSIHLKKQVAFQHFHDYHPQGTFIFKDVTEWRMTREETERAVLSALDQALSRLESGETLRVVFEAWETTREEGEVQE